MASRARALLAGGAALLAVACGTVTPGAVTAGTGTTGTGTTSATASRATKTATHAAASPAVAPAVTVTPAAVPGLADATLLDTSWVSATDGWALAVQQCARGDCTRIARTTDGGEHWQALPDPPAVPEGDYGCPDLACAAHVTFVSPRIGYLYGPALLMTTDGGRHWQPQPGPLTETLAGQWLGDARHLDHRRRRTALDQGRVPLDE